MLYTCYVQYKPIDGYLKDLIPLAGKATVHFLNWLKGKRQIFMLT